MSECGAYMLQTKEKEKQREENVASVIHNVLGGMLPTLVFILDCCRNPGRL